MFSLIFCYMLFKNSFIAYTKFSRLQQIKPGIIKILAGFSIQLINFINNNSIEN